MTTGDQPVVVLGAGPTGLAAAYTLARRGRSVVVIDRADGVGGLSKSIDFAGTRVDLGPHFFAAGIPELTAMRRQLLGDDEIFQTQQTRMFWQGHLVGYPPGLADVLRAVGVVEAGRIGASFLAATRRRRRPPLNYAQRASNAFGERIFETCLRGYVEKLWGIPSESIEPGWEPGRIRSVSLVDLAGRLVTGRTDDVTMSVPRHGSGQFYDAMAQDARQHGADVLLGHEICEIATVGNRITTVAVRAVDGGECRTIACGEVISTDCVDGARRPTPDHLAQRREDGAAVSFHRAGVPPRRRRRSVCRSLDLRERRLARDRRVTNFSNWGEAMHQRNGQTVLCVEFWCDRDDDTWTATDDALLTRVVTELREIGVLARQAIAEHLVIRIPNTHPVPEIGAGDSLAELRHDLAQFDNLHLAGRAGAFVYRDMDAVVMMGVETALALEAGDGGS